MLQKILKSPYASSWLKILFKNQTAVLIDYPSYKILAASDDIYPELNIVGKMPEEIDNPFIPHVQASRQEMLRFRVQGITSNWLKLLKIQTLASINLYEVVDTPIFHDDKLVGMLSTFSNVTMDSLHLVNLVIQNHDQANKSSNRVKYQELSNLEKEILFFAALGKSTKQISNIMSNLGIRDIAHNTVNSVISQRIYKKLEVQNISDAILAGIKTKQISSMPESLLLSKLKPYYLINTKKDCIIL
jgi:DNA-binding CsgD family transcriptional regulator